IAALCGTPYAVEARGAILALEDVDEAPYDIDRQLAQLRLSGILADVHGVAVGDIPAREVVDAYLRNAQRPAVGTLPFGHIEDQYILPVGATAELDTDEGTLRPLVTR
ncbi:MAG TPA: hypothetical protein VIK27_06140, partial [Candidatus Aquilonibacter sp.]